MLNCIMWYFSSSGRDCWWSCGESNIVWYYSSSGRDCWWSCGESNTVWYYSSSGRDCWWSCGESNTVWYYSSSGRDCWWSCGESNTVWYYSSSGRDCWWSCGESNNHKHTRECITIAKAFFSPLFFFLCCTPTSRENRPLISRVWVHAMAHVLSYRWISLRMLQLPHREIQAAHWCHSQATNFTVLSLWNQWGYCGDFRWPQSHKIWQINLYAISF